MNDAIQIYVAPGDWVPVKQFYSTMYFGRLYAVITGPDQMKLYSAGSTRGPIQFPGPEIGWVVAGLTEPCRIFIDGPVDQIWMEIHILEPKNLPGYDTGGPAKGIYECGLS